MEEIWKDIIGFEGLYQVSNLGRVRSLKRGGIYIFKEHIDNHGYSYAILYVSKKAPKKQIKVKIHRLVAQYFCDGYKYGLVVDHIDGNKRNNIYTNLEWVTSSENNKRAYAIGLKKRRLTERQKATLRKAHEATSHSVWGINTHTNERVLFKSLKEAARATGLTDRGVYYAMINKIVNRKGYKFELYEK